MADPTLDDDELIAPGLKYVKPRTGSVTLTLGAPDATPSKIDLEGINPDLKERINAASAAWLADKELNPKGIPFPITSGRRTREQQYQQYRANQAGSKTTGFMATNPDLFPGKQYFHEDAVDILPAVPDAFLSKFGLHRPYGEKDPVHVQINKNAPWAKADTDLTDDEGVDVPGSQYTRRQGIYTPTTTEAVEGQFENLKKDLTNPEFYTKALPKQAAALFDTLYGAIPGGIQFVGTPVAKLADIAAEKVYGQKPEVEKALGGLTQTMQQPLGKFFGITEEPAYKGEASQRIMRFVGENMGKGADWIAKQTGLPKSDVEWFMNAAVVAASPYAVKGAKKGYEVTSEAIPKAGQQLTQQFENVKSKVQEKFPSIVPEENPNLRSVGAAELPKARLRQENANSLLEPIQLSRDQATRDFKDINYAREKAKDPEVGAPLRAHYAEQNEKIIRNFDREIEATGAELTGVERGELGQKLNDVIDTYKKQRYQQVKDAYAAADNAGETLQQVPYQKVVDYINNIKSKRPTQYDQNPILKMVEEDIKANDPNKTGTINLRQLEDINQLINAETEFGTSNGFHGSKIRGEINKITESAGGDLYKEARALNSNYMKQFEETPAIRDITAIKKGTTERKIAVEDLVENSMLKGPRSRVEEIFNTLENAGPEGQQMINELRGVVAEYIKNEATKNVTTDINGQPIVSPAKLDSIVKKLDKSGKLDLIFGKDAAERYRTLNDVTKDIHTVPPGSVNTSGTAANLKSYVADIAATYALSGFPAPAAHLLKMGKEEVVKRRDLNRINEFINYGKEQK